MSHSTKTPPLRPEPHRRCPLCEEDNRQRPASEFSRDGWLLKDCPRCGMLYLENPPPVEAMAQEYHWSVSSEIEDRRRLGRHPLEGKLRIAWKWLRLRLLPRRKLAALVRRYVREGSLLDVGCGKGKYFPHLPACIVPHGIELDPDVIELARSRVGQRGGWILQADALGGLGAIAPETMRGVVMHSFLEHEVQAMEVLQSAQRVLGPDGVVIIKVPNFASWNRRYWHGRQWPGFRFPDHVNYFTPQTLSALVSKAGLKIIRFAWHDRLPTNDNIWMVAGKTG